MDKFKSGYVTIIGRPNVGKSTLMNNIMGEKLSIISNKPQTTRNTIQAILTKENSQIIFLDTPGMHKPRYKLGEYMVNVAQSTLNEVDLVLFLITPEGDVTPGDRHILDQLKNIKTPVILVVNKIDTVKKDVIAKTIKAYSDNFKFDEVVPVSALENENVDLLMNIIIDKLPEGPQYFPADMITAQAEKFVISEIIREKLLRNLSDEIPHGTAVEIMSMKEDEETHKTHIVATIYCEKESHKSIIIGKGGYMLKKVGKTARIDIEGFLGNKVFLELWVKVKKDWRDNPNMLKALGYK